MREALRTGAGELDLDPNGGVVDGLGAVDGPDAERLVFGRLGVCRRTPGVVGHDGILPGETDVELSQAGTGE